MKILTSIRHPTNMAAWSCLKNIGKLNTLASTLVSFRNASKLKILNYVPTRGSHEFQIRPSRYPLRKNRDFLVLYMFVGLLPIIAVSTYVNVFIGPAELALIPEGYEPKYWEYYRHPITRFIAKNFMPSPQERYERNMHNIFVNSETSKILKLKKDIRKKMSERLDYQAWYFDKPITKHGRKYAEDAKRLYGQISHRNNDIIE